MSNARHTPMRNDNIAIEQRTRMINELNQITNNTASSSSTLIKGLTDISDQDTDINVRVNTIGEIATTSHMKGTDSTNTERDVKTTSNGELITKNLNELLNDGKAQVFLSSAGGTSVKADSTCTIQADPEYRDGWNMVNATASTKFNLYIFNGAEETLTIGDLTSIYFKGYINRFTSIQSMPFLQIYTKPTGVGDAGGFFHSRINWVYNDDDSIGIGEECVFYAEAEPSSQFSNRKIELTSKVTLGDGADSEEILFIVCASDSSVSQNEMNSTINLIGFNDTNIKRNYHLVGRDLRELWESDISNNIKGDVDSINTSTAEMTSKMSKGQGDITDSSGLFQVLCYGKDQSNNLDPLNVDNNGHLKITINDVESGIVNPLKVSQSVLRTDIEITESSTGTALIGSISGQTFTETVDMDTFKEMTVLIDATAGSNLQLWASHSSTSGFVYYSEMIGEPSSGIVYRNDSFTPRYFRIYNQSTSVYTFTSIRVHLAR